MATKATNAKRCAAMTINPFEGSDIREIYPHLNQCVTGNEVGIDLNKFFRYLSLVYDYKSPLVADFPDLQNRKQRAADEVSFILSHEEDKQQRRIAILFLQKILKNRAWTLICSHEAAFDEITEKVNTPLSNIEDEEEMLKAVERKGKLLEIMDKIHDKLQHLSHDFFGGDTTLEGEGRNERFTSEQMAKLRKQR